MLRAKTVKFYFNSKLNCQITLYIYDITMSNFVLIWHSNNKIRQYLSVKYPILPLYDVNISNCALKCLNWYLDVITVNVHELNVNFDYI